MNSETKQFNVKFLSLIWTKNEYYSILIKFEGISFGTDPV